MLKLLHISDIHFDAIYGRYSDKLQNSLRESLVVAFKRAIDFACENEVDIVIIAGDVLDRGTLGFSTEQVVRNQISRLQASGIPLVMLHGNHDPSSMVTWPEMGNLVHIGRCPEPETVSFTTGNGETLHVSYNGFMEKAEPSACMEAFPTHMGEGYHLGVLHGFIAAGQAKQDHDPYMMTTLDSIARKGYDYWALGHIHQRSVFQAYKAAYPGSLQGVHINDSGLKGGLYVTLEKPGAHPTIDFVPFSPVVFKTLELDITEVEDTLHKVSAHCSKVACDAAQNSGAFTADKHIYRFILTGMNDVYERLREDRFLKDLELDIQEETRAEHVEIKIHALAPRIDRKRLLESSPFAAFIAELLESEAGREEILDYARSAEFVQMPDDAVQAKCWLEDLLSEVGDQWLLKMVRMNED